MPKGDGRTYVSPEGRKKISEAAKRSKPWLKSTGPRTEEGKAKTRYNALKHGRRSRAVILEGRIHRLTMKRDGLGEWQTLRFTLTDEIAELKAELATLQQNTTPDATPASADQGASPEQE